MDTQEFIKEFIKMVRKYAAIHRPDDEPDAFAVRFRKGGTIKVSIPRQTFSEAHGGLRESELLLLACLPENDKPSMAVKEILKKTGYSANSVSRVRKMLNSLVRKGVVLRDEAGFRKAKPES